MKKTSWASVEALLSRRDDEGKRNVVDSTEFEGHVRQLQATQT